MKITVRQLRNLIKEVVCNEHKKLRENSGTQAGYNSWQMKPTQKVLPKLLRELGYESTKLTKVEQKEHNKIRYDHGIEVDRFIRNSVEIVIYHQQYGWLAQRLPPLW
jgi:hypothetical protein